MAKSNDQLHRDKYDFVEVELYATKFKEEPTNAAFLFPAAQEYLIKQASGKKVLDIGCGTGEVCCGVWYKKC